MKNILFFLPENKVLCRFKKGQIRLSPSFDMTHNILLGIRVRQGCSAPTALIRKAIFKTFVQYMPYGYEMKALGPKITVKVILMSQF